MTDAQPPLHEVAFLDISHHLGQSLGALLPWVEPALATLEKGVPERALTLGLAPQEFLERYANKAPTTDLDSWQAHQLADAALAQYIMFKAAELRELDREMQDRLQRGFQ